ncbi:heterokaryon incompatibility protein-domain-containing protein [Hyaloscypha finlandica]|nr:heterokaryon incompatibility protein-domain-containing protein [Hyaloscypha finlandica]
MARAYQQMTLGPNESAEDFVDQLFKAIENTPQDSLKHRPLPQNPNILTFSTSSSLQHNTELWEKTCPVCRPIVRDLKVFCTPQDEQFTFRDQNIFIGWNVVFSSMASAIVTGEASAQDLDSTGDLPERHDQNEDARGSDGIVETEELQMEQRESYSGTSGEEAWDTETGDGKVIGKAAFCEFCAYFACLMFDDSMYQFSTSNDGTGDFEVHDCCCMRSMTDSKKVEKIAKKLFEYAEKFGQQAQIEFVIQPIDYDLKQQHFGRLRFQAYSRSPTISDQDLLNILGMRRELVLEVYGIPGQFSGDLPSIAHRPVSTSPEYWAGAGKEWLSTCISSHESCQSPIEGPLPSRVVEILDDENIRLVSGVHEVDSFYATLSYCWGGPQEIALTEETIAEKQNGFKITSLPATLKDAITVTRELGIKYIWIDSLCIIQDSKDDMLRELPRMAGYYANSYLTISASTIKCTFPFLSSEGICKKHPGSTIPKDLVPLRLLISPEFEVVSQKDGGTDRVGTRFSKDIMDWVLVRKEHPYFLFWEPIYKRGWTFQERVLSPRNLLFGGRLVWQCHSSQESFGGVTSWDDDASNVDHRMIGRLLVNAQNNKKKQEAPAGAETANKEQYDVWYKSVEEYTRRELSVSNDKLPAISALAQVFQDLTGDEYLAGIWRGDFLRGLLWSTYPTLTLSKPALWRAPSWSWVSNDNEVSYKGIPPPNSVSVARVLTSQVVTLSSIVPHGEIISATLEIEGPVWEFDKKVTIWLMQEENKLPGLEDTPEYRNQSIISSFSKNMKIDAGCQSWEPPDGHVFLVLLATPVKAQSNKAPDSKQEYNDSEPSGSGLGTELDSETIKDEDTKHLDEPTPNIDIDEKTRVAEPNSESSTNREGYSLSGLVLGPVVGTTHSDLKYERLARFTSIGVAICDYRDLAKVCRKLSIV